MISNVRRPSCLGHTPCTVALLAISLLLMQPDRVEAQQWTTHSNGVDIYTTTPAAKAGIGTMNPARKLEIGDASLPGIKLTHNTVGSFLLYVRNPGSRQFSIFDENAAVDRFLIDANGKIGIGTVAPSSALHVVGDLTLTGTGNISATGNIAAKYQDIAEWVQARNAIPVATVVVVDPDHSNHVLASSRAYDTRVAGVVSARPGVLLGEAGEGKVMVATTGRVKIKVDAGNGPIRVGDLLVTSDKEGIAMKSLPLDLGGTPIHRPGTLIGKALEPLAKGVGEILVLLSLQ